MKHLTTLEMVFVNLFAIVLAFVWMGIAKYAAGIQSFDTIYMIFVMVYFFERNRFVAYVEKRKG